MLDYKDHYILKLLLNSNYRLTIQDIQKLLGVSQRSVYYSINNINDLLETLHLPPLVNERNKGIFVDPVIKNQFIDDIFDSISELYVLTPEERNVIEMLLFICQPNVINISYLESLFDVSRNTITSDLKDVRKQLQIYNLQLDYDPVNGYHISGLEIQKRSVLLYLISSYDYLIKMNIVQLYDVHILKQVRELISRIEQSLQIQYVPSASEHLSMFISMLLYSDLPPIIFNESERNSLTETKEFQVIQDESTGVLSEEEIHYITIHFLGLRIHTSNEFDMFEDEYIQEIVEYMINEFSKVSLIYYSDDQLYNSLYFHMRQTLHRIKYGIIYPNELKDNIFESYPYISQITKTVCKKLEKKIGYPITDDDISYIAMHFGGSLKRKNQKVDPIKVLLVCLNGIATSKILRNDIESLFSNVEIIDAVDLEDVAHFHQEVDYIVSTVPINHPEYNHKVIHVNAILNDIDKEKLMFALEKAQATRHSLVVDKIYQIISKYIPSDKKEYIKQEIQTQLTLNYSKMIKNKERRVKPMLKDLVTKNHIVFQDSVETWQDAIWLSAKPLLDDQVIEKRYVKKVISNVIDLGPYIGIAPDIAISHARPEDGVHQLGMTFLLLKEPVFLNNQENKPVRVMITLASPDSEQHLKALQQLSSLLMDGLSDLLQSETVEEVLQIIEQYSK